jgi:hypothetical protein
MTLAQVATIATPWYAQGILTGCFVVTGATIALLSTYFSDKRRQKREDRQRWDTAIWETSSRVLTLCLQSKDARLNLGKYSQRALSAATSGDDVEIDRLRRDAPEALQLLKDINRLRETTDHELYSLSCIAPPKVWRAAFTLANVVTKMGTPNSDEEIKEASARIAVAQADFLTQIRFSIDAKGNDQFGMGGRWKTAKAAAREKLAEIREQRTRGDEQNRP